MTGHAGGTGTEAAGPSGPQAGPQPGQTHPAHPPVTLAQMWRVFGRIGLLSFGGPAAQIALMHRELVDRHRWLSEETYLRALSFCMLLPGPEAMQLATFAGWRLQGIRGGLLAGLLFVLPGAAVVLVLSMIYAAFGQVPQVQALFLGVKATVVIIVIEALLRVSGRALKQRAHWIIAGLAFVAIFLFGLPFPLIIAAAAAYGFATARPGTGPVPVAVRVTPAQTLRTVLAWAAVWLVPLALLRVSGATLLFDIGWFFSKLSVVTFGGAYAVLAYMTQDVVSGYGWLTTAQMIDGLGLAETTPGPLILVNEFVGYLAGHGAVTGQDGTTGGWPLGLAGAAVALWMTFAPCFLWIFAGAPYLDAITARPRLAAALQAITAAVVGVIANLSLWFALHVFFGSVATVDFWPIRTIMPDPATLDWRAAVLALAAGWALLVRHWSLPLVLALAALGGIAVSAIG